MIGQDLSEQLLNVVIASASDDRRDKFDFDSNFAIDIDLAFHTSVYRAVLKAQGKTKMFLHYSVAKRSFSGIDCRSENLQRWSDAEKAA